jgi:hypothetical protein
MGRRFTSAIRSLNLERAKAIERAEHPFGPPAGLAAAQITPAICIATKGIAALDLHAPGPSCRATTPVIAQEE